jgi:hypothetical protein
MKAAGAGQPSFDTQGPMVIFVHEPCLRRARSRKRRHRIRLPPTPGQPHQSVFAAAATRVHDTPHQSTTVSEFDKCRLRPANVPWGNARRIEGVEVLRPSGPGMAFTQVRTLGLGHDRVFHRFWNVAHPDVLGRLLLLGPGPQPCRYGHDPSRVPPIGVPSAPQDVV